jgi:rod shape-determining protein MreC
MSRGSIVAIIIFAAALLALLSIGPQATLKIQSVFYQTIAPFLKTGSGLERQITSVRSGLKSLDELERDNTALRVENRSLKATNEALRDVEHEVNRLRHALKYRERSLFRLVPAEVIARDSSTWWRTVTINRGEDDGLAPEMPVLTDEGLVGRTTTVSKTVSVVLLVSDENCRVAATVEGTREQGIVTGERVEGGVSPMLELNYLSKQAQLKEGQRVYTSGVGGVFPSGLFIGTVRSFKVRALDSQAKLTPAVDLAKLEDVFVVIGRK